MSTFAVFDSNGNRLGRGATAEAAIHSACETIAVANYPKEWLTATLIEWCRGDQIQSQCQIHPLWNESHITGQS